MKGNFEDRKKAAIGIAIAAVAVMLRSCNARVVKEEKQGIMVEPPRVEDYQYTDLFVTENPYEFTTTETETTTIRGAK